MDPPATFPLSTSFADAPKASAMGGEGWVVVSLVGKEIGWKRLV